MDDQTILLEEMRTAASQQLSIMISVASQSDIAQDGQRLLEDFENLCHNFQRLEDRLVREHNNLKAQVNRAKQQQQEFASARTSIEKTCEKNATELARLTSLLEGHLKTQDGITIQHATHIQNLDTNIQNQHTEMLQQMERIKLSNEAISKKDTEKQDLQNQLNAAKLTMATQESRLEQMASSLQEARVELEANPNTETVKAQETYIHSLQSQLQAARLEIEAARNETREVQEHFEVITRSMAALSADKLPGVGNIVPFDGM